MISKFNNILQGENIYTIHNLKIVSANDAYKLVKGPFKGLFLLTIVVKKINNISISIPLHYFEFGSMETLAQRVDDRVVLTCTTLIFCKFITNLFHSNISHVLL